MISASFGLAGLAMIWIICPPWSNSRLHPPHKHRCPMRWHADEHSASGLCGVGLPRTCGCVEFLRSRPALKSREGRFLAGPRRLPFPLASAVGGLL